MRNLFLRLVPGTLMMAALMAVPASSWGENRTEFAHSDSRSADATFTLPVSGDQTGCLEVSYDVRTDLVTFRRKDGPGAPVSGSFSGVGISIIEFNTCTSTITLYHECSTANPTSLYVAPSLREAALDTTLTCFDPYDFGMPTYELDVDLTWTATGPPQQGFSRDRMTEFGVKTFAHLHTLARPAVASGTLFLNGETVILEESDSAVLFSRSRRAHTLLQCQRNPELCLPR